MYGNKGNRIMRERAKQAQERAKQNEKMQNKNNDRDDLPCSQMYKAPQAPVQNIPDDFNPYGAHVGVIALSDISLNLLSLLPPTMIAAITFRLLRNAEVTAGPALMISGGLAWLGYKIAEPHIFEEKAVARLRDW